MYFGRAIALLATSLVLTACGGGESSAPIAAQDAPDAALATAQGAGSARAGKVIWTPGVINVTTAPGTFQSINVSLIASQAVDDVSIFVAPELSGFVGASLHGQTFLAAGVETIVPVVIAPSANALPGIYEGTIHLRSAKSTVPATLKVAVTVQPVGTPKDVVDMSIPTPDRLVLPATGLPYISDELLIVIRDGVADPLARVREIAALVGGTVVGRVPGLTVFQVQFGAHSLDAHGLDTMAERISAIPDVEVATRNLIGRPLDCSIPGFPCDNPARMGWDSSSFTIAKGNESFLEFIGMPEAWKSGTGDPTLRVAVIDEYFDWKHPDLRANILERVSPAPIMPDVFTRSPFDPVDLNTKVHGTEVAGTICAHGNNKRGVTGVAWQCQLDLYSISMFGTTCDALQPLYPGLPCEALANAATMTRAMQAAVDNQAKIVNISWALILTEDEARGKCDPSVPLDEFRAKALLMNRVLGKVLQAAGNKVLWVFGAGNECRDAKTQSPASLSVGAFADRVITVGGVDIPDGSPIGTSTVKVSLWERSNRGEAVTVAAPATVYTTFPRYCVAGFCFSDEGLTFPYEAYSRAGPATSFAAPQVAGLASLVWTALKRRSNSEPTAAQVRTCIKDAADTSGAVVTGHAFRVINAPEAVKCAPAITTQPASITVDEGATATFSVVATGSPPLTYQWRKNGVDIAGATSATYTTPPTTAADNNSEFTVLVSNGGTPQLSNPARLTVRPAQPQIGIAPLPLDFGGQQLGTPSTPKSFTITNAGSAPLVISSVTAEGANAGDFAIANQTCTKAPLAPAGGCSVSVVFTPSALGARSADLIIADNAAGAPHSAGLAGTGLAGPPPPPTAQILATGPNITEHIALDGGYVYYFTNETAATPQRWTLHRVSINGGPAEDLATGTTYYQRVGRMAITPKRIAMVYYDQSGHTVLQVADKNSTARPLPFTPIATDVPLAISGAIGEDVYLQGNGVYCPGAFCRINLDNPLDVGTVGSGIPYYNLIDAPYIYFFADYYAGPVWRVNTATNAQELVTGSTPLPQIKWFALDANNVYVSSLWIDYSTVLGNPGLYRISKSNFADTANLQTQQSYVSMVLAAVGGKVYFAEGVVGSFNVRSVPSTGGAVSNPLFNGSAFPYSTQTDGAALYWMDQGIALPQSAIVKLPIQ